MKNCLKLSVLWLDGIICLPALITTVLEGGYTHDLPARILVSKREATKQYDVKSVTFGAMGPKGFKCDDLVHNCAQCLAIVQLHCLTIKLASSEEQFI